MPRSTISGGRIPSLDGLRAISIALVVAGHVGGTATLWGGVVPWVGGLGNLGVRVFFVISGFLITGLLLEELGGRGTISLGRFYLRRAFRILPASLTYLGAVAALGALGAVVLAPGDLAHGFTYTVNYHHRRSWYVSHLWSLSVEEQFYLLWPLVLLLAGARDGVRVAVAFIGIAPLIRIATWVNSPEQRVDIGEAFSTVADALAAGCVLAGVRARLGSWRGYLRFLRSPVFLVVPILVVVAAALERHPVFDLAAGQTVMNTCIALVIDRSVRHADDDAVGRFLNARPVAFLGTLSYSLYLWQEPFLNRYRDGLAMRFPLNVLLALTCALASYAVVERPFLRLRSRLVPGPR